MKLNLFFLKDKVLVEGPKKIHVTELENLRKELLSGVLLARKVNDEHYYISSNKLIEQEVLKTLTKKSRNARSKIYKLLQCREPAVINKFVERIKDTAPPKAWNQAAWLSVLSTGVYFEHIDDQSGDKLDAMVYKGRLEYESYGTYSLSSKYISRILMNDEVFASWLYRYLDCKDEGIVDMFMERLGYDRNRQKYVKRDVKAIGFIV